ncbi:ATP-dependent protease La domain-containing protein [Lasiosphaeria ovina]|uniref:ATP-dependent protease La domain-containing protein n=1 Tax=Lasiosphaeria ovina TaxID=92902 RepID=A0AAE0TUP9_9PEZI|nr:ATP-dependent protease La domain-containing protein [Lasiosphaeria ovina]
MLQTPSSSCISTSEGEASAPVDWKKLAPEQIRQIIRLIQCPICSLPLDAPVILPCGQSICRKCLPQAHRRTNITYPLEEKRRREGILCPLPGCDRDHAADDCSSHITLRKVLDAARSALETSRDSTPDPDLDLDTTVIVDDEPLSEDFLFTELMPLDESRMMRGPMQGPRLIATWIVAESGELRYNANATYNYTATEAYKALESDVVSAVREAVERQVDCQICYRMLYEPVTTPCGHTFCRSCLQSALNSARHCPICRHALSIDPQVYPDSSPPCQPLTDIISYFWADTLEERRRGATKQESGGHDIPIFICTLSFPGVPTFLHVFEAKYRLLIQRALEGDRTFGMVLYSEHGNLREFGTMLRIESIEFFPDGRSVLEAVGISRFRILEHGTLDGYIVAKTQTINDMSVAEEEDKEIEETRLWYGARGSSMASQAEGSIHGVQGDRQTRPRTIKFPKSLYEIDHVPTIDLMAFCVNFVRQKKENSVGWLKTRIITIYGECPENDPDHFPWWFASILPIKDSHKYRLLETRSVRERIKICCQWIIMLEESMW